MKFSKSFHPPRNASTVPGREHGRSGTGADGRQDFDATLVQLLGETRFEAYQTYKTVNDAAAKILAEDGIDPQSVPAREVAQWRLQIQKLIDERIYDLALNESQRVIARDSVKSLRRLLLPLVRGATVANRRTLHGDVTVATVPKETHRFVMLAGDKLPTT